MLLLDIDTSKVNLPHDTVYINHKWEIITSGNNKYSVSKYN